jgi:hypothetical protein
MQKYLTPLILFFLIGKTFACSCDIPKPILEFESAEYVFEGKVISKIYANDSLTYTVTFEISKHYKNSGKPKIIEFTFKSEEKYTGEWTSCDWNVNKDENWLVYANYWNEKLTFRYYCSNSKPLDRRTISKNEQKVLDNGNTFKLENYIYQSEPDFNYTKPISDIDSILKTGKIKDYERPFTWLKLFIDRNGNLNSVSTQIGYQLKMDTIYNLPTEFKIKLIKSLSEFEKDAIELVKKIQKWEIKRHNKTNVPVPYIQHLAIEFDKKKWKYEL